MGEYCIVDRHLSGWVLVRTSNRALERGPLGDHLVAFRLRRLALVGP